MVVVDSDLFKDYSDENNNVITSDINLKSTNSKIKFVGKNNLVTIGKNVHLKNYRLIFQSDNSHFLIGDNSIYGGGLMIGAGCTVSIGNNFNSVRDIMITAAEETSISIGNSCLFNENIQIRSHDTHAIFDVNNRRRINKSKSIHIGNKVWIGNSVTILKGVRIGDNSVIGLNSVVTKSIPNNCLAVGNPAKVKKNNISWNRRGLRENPFPDFEE